MVDNTWIVPYNPWLLLKYNCHINVEICCSIKSVKCLYKYVYKSPDRVSMEVRQAQIMMRSNSTLMQDGYVLQRHVGRYFLFLCIECTLL